MPDKTLITPALSPGPDVYDTPDGLKRLQYWRGGVTKNQVEIGTPRQVAVRNQWLPTDGGSIEHDLLELDALAFDYTFAVPEADTDVLNSMMDVIGGRGSRPVTFSANAETASGERWAAETASLTIRQAQTLGDLEAMLQSLAAELASDGETGLASALQRMRWYQRIHPDVDAEIMKIDSDQPTDRGEQLFLPGELARTNVTEADDLVGDPHTHEQALEQIGLTLT